MELKFAVCLFFLVIFANDAISYTPAFTENDCNCVLLNNCPQLFTPFQEAKRRGNHLRDQLVDLHCGWLNNLPKVCCPCPYESDLLKSKFEKFQQAYLDGMRNEQPKYPQQYPRPTAAPGIQSGWSININSNFPHFKLTTPHLVRPSLSSIGINGNHNVNFPHRPLITFPSFVTKPANVQTNDNDINYPHGPSVNFPTNKPTSGNNNVIFPHESKVSFPAGHNNHVNPTQRPINHFPSYANQGQPQNNEEFGVFVNAKQVPASSYDHIVDAPQKPNANENFKIEDNLNCGGGDTQGKIQFANASFGNRDYSKVFPWLALLEFDTAEGKEMLCGGSLITDQVVLTSAHCITSPSNTLTSVRLGEQDISKSLECYHNTRTKTYDCGKHAINVPVRSIIIHENYENGVQPRLGDFKNNVALVILQHKVSFSDYIQPVCLPTSVPVDSRIFYVGGWSRSMIPGNVGLSHKSVSMLSGSGDSCNQQLHFANEQEHICVGSAPGSQGKNPACIADAGGPLVTYEKKRDNSFKLTLYGVSSADVSCQQTDFQFGLFTRINKYLPWINQKLRQLM